MLALSLEFPGSRGMRGLAGLRDDGPGPERGPGRGHRRGHGPDGGHDRGHGPRGRLQARRGLIREAILGLLAEQPMHGYQIIQELSTRTGGRWQPSAGSIYPTLQQLEDEGLVLPEEREGRRTFALTDAGRTAAADLPAGRPWSADAEGRDRRGRGELRGMTREIGIAALQVSRVGSPEAQAEAARILTETRRSLYRLLAEDDGASGAGAPAAEPTPTVEPDAGSREA